MKITFIRPNMVEGRSADAIPPLAIAALSAHTPREVELEFFDECVEKIPADLDTDIAALTVHTFAARRAYEIADRLRSRGIRVVMGGYHPTFLPEEALEHADAVLAGHAERSWRALVEDALEGKLGRLYGSDRMPDASDLRYDMGVFGGKKYNPIHPVEFSRGCRYECEFCSVSAFNQYTHIARPHEAVIEDIRRSGARRIAFVDDNVLADRTEATRLFEALIPLNIKWGCQVSLDVATTPDILRLMARSGCTLFMVGIESLRAENLKQMKKGSHASGKRYGEAIARIREHGIIVWASFVFGYDFDTEDVFDQTLGFAMKHKFIAVNFNTLNPMPGTRLYGRLKVEGRLLEERWWLHEKYRYGEVMFLPRRMTREQLKQGCIRMRFAFSRLTRIVWRALDFKANARNLTNVGLFLLVNMITRKEYKAKMKLIR